MCIDRIMSGANKIDKANHLGGTTKCETKVKKRNKWVKYLKDRANKTSERNKGNMMLDGMIDMINTQVYTDKTHTERIVIITKIPNDT